MREGMLVILSYFLAPTRFFKCSNRSVSAISPLKVREGYRSQQDISLLNRRMREEKDLPWSESYRLWNWYQPSHNEVQIGSIFNESDCQNYDKVSQRDSGAQDWWSLARVAPIREHSGLDNDHFVDNQSREVINQFNLHDRSRISKVMGTGEFDIRRRHKLLDPQREFEEICLTLNNNLFYEYIREGNNLKTILDLADKMRQSNVEKTPLLNLITRLGLKKSHHSLIPSLYNAFMKSSEVNSYSNRAEILLPAIAYAFQSNDPIKDVHLLFKRFHNLLRQNKQPEYVNLLQFFIRIKFKYFIYELKQKIENKQLTIIYSALQIEEVASSLRECFSSPLADSIDLVLRNKIGDDCSLHLYRAFLKEPSELNLFADRNHIFFPWFVEVLNENKLKKFPNPVWVAVLDKLMEMDLNSNDRSLPHFMVKRLRNELGNLFDYACMHKNFNISQRVWNYCKINDMLYKCSSYSLFLFALYHWRNGRKKEARIVANVLHSQIRFIRKASKIEKYDNKLLEELKQWKSICDRFSKINNCYKDIMDNPQTKKETKKVCNKILNGFVNDFLNKNNRE